jgi:hypothetical protein
MKLLTQEQINKKYKGRYIDIYPHHFEFWNSKTNKYETVYEVRKVYKTAHENTTLGEDVGTRFEYCR